MLDKFKEYSHDNELLLYERGGIYQARVYAGDRKYVVKSLKTRDLNAARKAAERYYYEVRFKQEEARPIRRTPFADIVREYVAAREAQRETGLPLAAGPNHKATISDSMLRQVKRVSKFWIEFSGNRDITAIDNAALREYVEWRRDYYPSRIRAGIKISPNAAIEPKPKTLVWELTFAKSVWRWAAERKLTGSLPAPTYHITGNRVNPRPAFEVEEYLRIRWWLRDQSKRLADDPERAYTYQMLCNYVAILATTGMRVGEANNLQCGDVVEFKDEKGRRNYMIKVRGKTGERVVIPRIKSARWIENQRNLWPAFVELRERMGVKPKNYNRKRPTVEGDWLFKMSDGEQIITLADQFNRALDATGTAVNRYGEKRTLYSLRHFYAVQMLRRGVPVYDVARNMGTSVVMIESHYGKHATALTLATTLGN